MTRAPKIPTRTTLPKARVAVFRADVRRLLAKLESQRAIAGKDAREEVREIRTRLLPQIVALQAHMLLGELAIDPEWCRLAKDFIAQSEPPPAQALHLSGELAHRITTIEVHQPCQ